MNLTQLAAFQMVHYLKIVPKKKHPPLYKWAGLVGYLASSFGLLHDKKTYEESPSKSKYYSEYLYYQALRICEKINNKYS